MTLTDLFDTAVRLLLVLITLSGLAAIEMILAARMLRVPETPRRTRRGAPATRQASAPSPQQ